jgi:CRP-like cAMP-binding protein
VKKNITDWFIDTAQFWTISMRTMTKSLVTQVLTESGWLSLTPIEFRSAVLERISLHEFGRGESVYRFGDPPGGLWAVVDGTVEIEIPGPESAPSFARFATPGFWLGEGALIRASPRQVGVVATGRCIMAYLPLADCRRLLEEDPSRWRWIALLSTMNLDLALRLAADLLLREPEKRTAAMILRLAGLRNGAFLRSTPGPIRLSQEKLGMLVNLSRNAIGPIIRDFTEKDLIEVRYRVISVRDEAGLLSILSR